MASEALDVSVPCSGCGGAVRFQDARCPGCGAPIGRLHRRALERRLQESSVDFRELREQTRSASTVVLVTALAYLAAGVLGYVVYTRSLVRLPEDDAAALVVLVERCSIGVVLGVLGLLVPRHPVSFLTAALLVWLGVQAVAGLVLPMTIWHALWLKLIALTLLVRGTVAAFGAERVLRRLRSGSS